MATAASRVIPAQTVITLELSVDEAQTLVEILSHVGGSPEDSPRKYVDTMFEALKSAGLDATDSEDRELFEPHQRYLMFS